MALMSSCLDFSGNRKEKVIVMSGPSGTGKASVKTFVHAISPFYQTLPYLYTRPRRPYEQTGSEFLFVEEEVVLGYPNREVFRECLYEEYWQAVRRSDLEAAFCGHMIRILEIPRLLAFDVMNAYPEVQSVFLSPVELVREFDVTHAREELERRQRERASASGVQIDEKNLQRRLDEGVEQLRTAVDHYRDIIVVPAAPPGQERLGILLRAALRFIETTLIPFLRDGSSQQ